MAKVKIDTTVLEKKIRSALGSVLSDNDVYVDISKFATERIRNYARLQKRMVQDGEDKAKTPKLSDKYVDYRKKLTAGQKGTDPTFFFPQVKNSQLTFTGQLLNSLTGKILKKGPDVGRLELSFQGRRKDGQTNSAVYKKLLDRNADYNVLALSKKAIERIRTIVLNKLRKELVRQKLK